MLLLRLLAWVVVAVAAAPGRGTRQQQHLGVDPDLLAAELRAWKDEGHSDFIVVQDDHRNPVWGKVDDDGLPNTDGRPSALNPTNDDIKFHVFTKNNDSDIEGAQVTLNKTSFLAAGWDADLPTKVIIHGFTNTIASPAIQGVKNAYLGSGQYNVVGVDWGALCPAPLYLTARMNVPFVGNRVGEMLEVLVSEGLAPVDRLHVMGHSLGAHVAGLAGKALNDSLGQRPNRITGLDPAWPLFILTPEADRLNKENAEVVDVMHTCAGELGFYLAIGTSDFYPNGGSGQPGCGIDALCICSHGRAHEYFAETIKDGKGFTGDYCKDWQDARKGQCTDQVDGCMGDDLYFKETGSFYVNTTNNSPNQRC